MGFFGELGHGADPRARKKPVRLLDVSLQRIAVKVAALDVILNGALTLGHVLDLDHGRRPWPPDGHVLDLALALDHGR